MTSTERPTQFSEPVDILTFGERTFYLVGTAHVSKASAELAEEVIAGVRPDSVAVELCEPRFRSLNEPERWKNTDIFTVIKAGNTHVLVAQLILAAFQKKLGDRLNIRPGEEMMRAVRAADGTGSKVVLADREIKTTLKRTWAALGFWSMMKIVHALLSGLLTEKTLSAEEIEKVKSQENLDSVLKEFSAVFPKIKEALISERDRYMASKIFAAPGNIVVAVVGAGHIPGIKQFLGTEIDLAPLEQLPPPGAIARGIKWLIPVAVISLFAAAIMSGDSSQGVEMAQAWFWVTGVSAALGCLVTLAHPLTVICTFISAPFTSLNPFMRPGWIGGLVEALIRKPKVSDLEGVTRDITSIRGVWRNGVSRILLLVLLTNLFGLIGALYGVKALAGYIS